ncbi:MAG: alpha-galactosidase, partial [Spirochaetes bacterium]|nr:alpha-galactosidase [Spirochaetota bacterium]
MEFLFEEHCIECIYEKDGTVTSIKTFNCKKENYINNTAYVYYNRNRNFKLSIKPFTRLYIKKLILTFQTNCANVSCFVNGYQSWTYTGVFDAVAKKRKPWLKFVIANQENAANPPKGKRGLVQSDMFFLCGDSNSQSSVLFGQLPVKKQFQQFISFEFDYRTQLLSIIWDIDRYCDAHEEYILDPVCMLQGDAWRILQTYAESISQELSPTFNRNIRKGWCSWYYYYNSITKDEIIANAKYAKEHDIPFDFIQIDDGYQTTIGEWTTVKGSFTAAMRYIADTIKDYGFTPGIWYSPFIVSKDSRIFKENKSWILNDSEGKPVIAGYNPAWGGYYFTVDVTLPAVLSWIEDTINTLLYE